MNTASSINVSQIAAVQTPIANSPSSPQTDANGLEELLSPVDKIVKRRSKKDEQGPQPGIALCLSGGGYRALLFHLGTLWRLNQVAMLPKIDRISSVSGGSIAAALLGLKWEHLAFDSTGVASKFESEMVAPLRALTGRSLDVASTIGGVFGSGNVGDWMAASYRKHLFGSATLQNLPDRPRFVINATNVGSGALWRFMKPYMRDYRVGSIENPEIELAVAVAASAAFPPFLSPVVLELEPSQFVVGSGLDLQREPFTTQAVLTDGGVYDNLGLETAWKRYQTLLVSDGGGQIEANPHPKRDWARHTAEVLSWTDNQVRALRKRQVIGSLVRGERLGAYWGIRTDIADYRLDDALPCPHHQTLKLAKTPTRLKALDPHLQEQIINWGYAVCDAALRTHVNPQLGAPMGFPYPNAGV